MCYECKNRIFISLFIVLFTVPIAIKADQINELFNTGTDDNGNVIETGALEQHYTMTGPDAPAYVVEKFPTWVTPPAGSAWIGPFAVSIYEGYNSYFLTFDLSGLDPNTANITGVWSADNSAEIFINGQTTGITCDWLDFDKILPFSISAGFISGINTIEFEVYNAFGVAVPNPSGLLVANLEGFAATLECSARPLSDITGDCRVNLEDLAILASEWLTCNLTIQEDC